MFTSSLNISTKEDVPSHGGTWRHNAMSSLLDNYRNQLGNRAGEEDSPLPPPPPPNKHTQAHLCRL
jgi:hypothetical protein